MCSALDFFSPGTNVADCEAIAKQKLVWLFVSFSPIKQEVEHLLRPQIKTFARGNIFFVLGFPERALSCKGVALCSCRLL